MSGKLYLVGTPIGNLGDISPRCAETLAAVDCVAAEDNVEEEADAKELVKILNRFLAGLGREKQIIFMKRY